MRLDEYAGYDAVGLAHLVRTGEVSAAELTELAIAGAAAVDPQLNALVELYDDARDRGVAADTAPTGPLAGVPMVRKDIGAPEAGKRTELGSRLAEGLVTHRDSHLTAAFKEAGLVIIGRSATSEFGCYGTVETALRGTTNNPWKPGHTSGGSSGGSAALVAAGVVPIGHANDGAGSIRIPASCCGLVGLKPSRGRVSAGPGAGEPNFGGSVQLVVTRTLADTATVLDAVGGPRPGDPFVIPGPDRPYGAIAASAAAGDVGSLRIGLTTAPWGPGVVHPEVAAAVRATGEALEALGHHVQEADFPFDFEQFEHPFMDLWALGTAGPIVGIGERMHRPLSEEFLEPVTLAWLEHYHRLTAGDIPHALDQVNRMARRAGVFFTRYDLLLTPTLAQPPVPFGMVNGTRTDLDAAGNARALLEFNPYCPLFNLTGQPALTLPLAQSADGLPIGVQLVARHAEEAALVAVGAQLEQAMPWAARRPAVHVAGALPGR